MKEFNQVELEKHIEDLQNGMPKNGLFSIRTANQCLKDASKRPTHLLAGFALLIQWDQAN